MSVFIVLWPYLLTTKLRCLQKNNIGHTKQGIINMFTDASFQYCTHETINYLVQYGVTVYQYILTYEGKYSFSTLDGVPVGTGVTHGDDLFYLWDMPYLTDLGYNIGKI